MHKGAGGCATGSGSGRVSWPLVAVAGAPPGRAAPPQANAGAGRPSEGQGARPLRRGRPRSITRRRGHWERAGGRWLLAAPNQRMWFPTPPPTLGSIDLTQVCFPGVGWDGELSFDFFVVPKMHHVNSPLALPAMCDGSELRFLHVFFRSSPPPQRAFIIFTLLYCWRTEQIWVPVHERIAQTVSFFPMAAYPKANTTGCFALWPPPCNPAF